MLRNLSFALLACALAAAPRAQGSPETGKFASEFAKQFELKDDKGLDKLLRTNNDMPAAGITYFMELRIEMLSGKPDLQPKTDMIKASWARVFDKSPVLEKLERWVEGQDQRSFSTFRKVQMAIDRVWRNYSALVEAKEGKQSFVQVADTLRECAKQMEGTGNMVEAAETWKLLAYCQYNTPDKTVEDRRDYVFSLEQYISLRQAWGWTQDPYFAINQNSLKGAKQALEAKVEDANKRKVEGYAKDAKGIDALVMPGVAEVASQFTFEMLETWDSELDWFQRGGPVQPLWWSVSFGKDKKDVKFSGYHRSELSMVRLGATKFGVSLLPSDEKRTQEVDVSGKAKAAKFFLDPDHHIPYAMFFWLGTDRERLGEAEVNLAPSDVNTNVYYRSASSWTTTVAGESLTLYDDNANGWPMDGDPFELPFPLATIGYPMKDAAGKDEPRSVTPMLDSMRIGKGPRGPFSEFVQIGGAWLYVHRSGDRLGMKPLNAEYLKLGKVKLVWSGPKPTAPVQLCIQGSGDFKTACFDVASGKEIDVPGGEYSVIWGRIVQGKGARVQQGTIYRGDSKPFLVEAGKTFELKMGAPFKLDFDRGGTGADLEVDGTRIRLQESSGCVIAELHGMALSPELLASKMADGKGAKPIAKFVRFTDSELLGTTANKYPDIGLILGCMPMPETNKDGSMVLKTKLAAAGMKVGLSMKKHPLFGKLDSDWK